MARTSKPTPSKNARPSQPAPPASIPPHRAGLWKPAQAADFLGVSEQRLARMRSDGAGPNYVKFGREIRYLPGELHKYVLAHTIVTNDG